MGFSNGTPDTLEKEEKGQRGEKGDKGERGEGFKLTADNHYHLDNERLTNLSAPLNDNDVTTKKFVTDLLKTKAGTTFVVNELKKKVNNTALNDYVLKSDLPSNDALADYALKTDLVNYVDRPLVLQLINDEHVFLHTADIIHDNESKLRIDGSFSHAETEISDQSHFSTEDGYLKVSISGCYRIVFIDSYRTTQSTNVYFRETDLSTRNHTDINFMSLNNTDNHWYQFLAITVKKVKANTHS